jgi:hypothetical protein
MSKRGRKGRLGTGRRDWLWIVAFVVAGGAAAFLAIVALSGGSEADEPPIGGVECEAHERLNYHVHSRLDIFVEGQPVEVPANIGVKRGECLYWLHTHEGQPGIIHVEAPTEGDYTLGQLFAIWGQPLSSTQLLDRTADADHEIRATVGAARHEGDPATILLKDGTAIRLEYGPPFQGE